MPNKTTKTTKKTTLAQSMALPSLLFLCVAIVLLAFNMRVPIVLLGSIAPLLEQDLSIGQVQIGWLGAIPMFMFSLGALLSARFSRYFGLYNLLPMMIAMMIVGILLRSVLVSWGWFFLGTLLLSLAIGFLNTLAMPAIKGLAPQRIPLVTGLYSLTMTISAGLVAGIIVPISEQVGWQWGAGGWVVISVLALFIWLKLRPMLKVHINQTQSVTIVKADSDLPQASTQQTDSTKMASINLNNNNVNNNNLDKNSFNNNNLNKTHTSIWKTSMAWYLAIFLGIQSLMYYTVASFLPSIWASKGLSLVESGQMAMLFQLMSPIAITSLTFLMNRQPKNNQSKNKQNGNKQNKNKKDYARVIAMISSVLIALGSAGMLVANFAGLSSTAMLAWASLWTMCIGLGTSGVFTLSIMLMSLRTHNAVQAGELSGMSQAVGYAIAIAGPLGMGWLLEVSGSFRLPLMILTILMVINIGFAWLASRAVMVDGKEIDGKS